MRVIAFKVAVVSVGADGKLLLALMDGCDKNECVALLMCSSATGWALAKSLGSVLKAQE